MKRDSKENGGDEKKPEKTVRSPSPDAKGWTGIRDWDAGGKGGGGREPPL